MSPRVSFRLTPEALHKAAAVASQEGKTISQLAREALEARLRGLVGRQSWPASRSASARPAALGRSVSGSRGAQRARPFGRKVNAGRFLTKTEGDKLRGAYVDPKEAARTFRDFAEQHWHSYSHTLAGDTTRIRKRSVLDNHILPTLGAKQIGGIRPSTVAGAMSVWSITLAPGTIGQVLRQVRQILDAAVLDGVVPSNAAKAVRPPTAPRRRDVHLTDDDVRQAVAVAPEPYRNLVVTLTGLGLRVSEACGLRVGDVDFLQRVVHIRQQPSPGGVMGSSRQVLPLATSPPSTKFRRLASESGAEPARTG